jgi:secreted Zn-dependent insulinase-like peptidase
MLASRLHKFDLQRALENDVAMDCFDEHVFKQFLAYFRVSNLRIFCIHPNAACTQKTAQYEVPFSIRGFESSKNEDFHPSSSITSLELPQKNPYMTDKFNLVEKELKSNELITIRSSEFLLKFSQNHHFKTPKGDCYLSLENPNMIGSARNLAIKKLWIACLGEELSETYSGAEMAGINFRLYGQQGGMTLHSSGFSDRPLILCEEILSFIQRLRIKKATFCGVKEKLTASLKNTLLNKPINQLFSDLNILMQENTFNQNAILEQVASIELAELNEQASTYFEKVHIEGLVVGNWSISQINAFHTKVVDCFKDMDKVLKSSRHIAHISSQKLCIQHNQSHHENAIVLYFQSPYNSNLNRALYIAIEKLLSPIFFDEMRNKRNLGYLVGCGYFPVNKRPGLALYVQSPNHSSNALFLAMKEVIHEFVQNIAEFEPIFLKFKQSLKKQFNTFDANTNQFAQRLWMDFDELTSSTDNNQMEKAIDDLSFERFKHECEDLILQSSLGTVVFITEPDADTGNSFAGFDFIDDPSLFKNLVTYQ